MLNSNNPLWTAPLQWTNGQGRFSRGCPFGPFACKQGVSQWTEGGHFPNGQGASVQLELLGVPPSIAKSLLHNDLRREIPKWTESSPLRGEAEAVHWASGFASPEGIGAANSCPFPSR